MDTTKRIADLEGAREQIRHLIRRGVWLLDNEQFAEWAQLFTEDGQYEVVVFSPEIQRQMTWMRASRTQLEKLFGEMPNHIREDARRAHIVMEISLDIDGSVASAISRFVVYKTNQRGETQVYAVGHYRDEFSGALGTWRLTQRKVVLDTRMFDVFPHMTPL